MKKQHLFYLLAALFAVMLAGCATGGLSANKYKKADLQVNGFKQLDGYDEFKPVYISDSLYTNGEALKSKAKPMKPTTKARESFVQLNGFKKLPKYIFQVRDSASKLTPENYLWAAGITRAGQELKVQTILDINEAQGKPKAGPKNNIASGQILGEAIAGEPRTFDMYGSEIKAVIVNDNSIAGYVPAIISFFLSPDQSLDFVHYSYNGRDYKVYNLNDPSQFRSLGGGIYSREINLAYGDRFSLRNSNGLTPNIDPVTTNLGRIKLDGITVAENPMKEMGDFYVFQVIGAEDAINKLWKNYNQNTDNSSMKDNDTEDYESSVDGDEVVAGTANFFKRARKANPENYPNGHVIIPVEVVAREDYKFFCWLASIGAIGLEADNTVQKNVWVSPEVLKRSPVLDDMYQDKIIK